MKARLWDTPIRASWHRANELAQLSFGRDGLTLKLVEEETEQAWVMNFRSVQAFRSTTEECAGSILSRLPEKGGFFEIVDSPWLEELGRGRVSFLDEARHYVICCYEEVIEVVSNACNVEKS
jgi:hypothetical protein